MHPYCEQQTCILVVIASSSSSLIVPFHCPIMSKSILRWANSRDSINSLGVHDVESMESIVGLYNWSDKLAKMK